MFEAVIIMLGIGAVCGIVLSVASKAFYVWEDPRISQVEYFMVGGGRRAARSIHQYLTGQAVQTSPKSLRKKHIAESLFKTVPGVEKKPARPCPNCMCKSASPA